MTVHPAQPIDELPLSHQARRVCQELGVQTVGDLLARRKRDFLAVHGCGERTWAELSRIARAARESNPPSLCE